MLLTQQRLDKQDVAIQMIARKRGVLLPNNLDDITPDWEPSSSGSRHSPVAVEVAGDLQHSEPEFEAPLGELPIQNMVSIIIDFIGSIYFNFCFGNVFSTHEYIL
jgi:hypothetical protein